MILALTITPGYYLALGALLFIVGAVGLLIRRNPLIMFMCVELMLNAVNLSFVAFGDAMGDLGGQVSVFFVLVVGWRFRFGVVRKWIQRLAMYLEQ